MARESLKDDLAARLVISSLISAPAQDPSTEVRAKAASSLALLAAKATAAVPALIDALDDREPIVHHAAMHALAAIGPTAKPALPRLIAMVENAPADRPAPEEVRALIANVDNDSYAVRSKATHAWKSSAAMSWCHCTRPSRKARPWKPSAGCELSSTDWKHRSATTA